MKSLHPIRCLALAIATWIPAACGGGGGGGTSAAGAATLRIESPAKQVTTTAAQIRVRGSILQPSTGSGTGITGVEVAGVAATSTDGFATWVAEVPLVRGPNELPVVLIDAAGSTAERERISVTRWATLLNGGNTFVPSPDGSRLYFIDNSLQALVEVEVATGLQRLVAQGSFLQRPNRICLDPTGMFAYLTDLDRDAVVEILLSTGAHRTVTSTSMNSSFPLLGGPDDLVYDLGHGPARLILCDYTRDGLVAVELATGVRSYVSKPGERGSGPAFQSPRGICWSGPDTVLVCDLGTDEIFQVNVVSGSRTIVASDTVGSGTSIEGPYDIVATNNPDEFLYVDLASNKLALLNLPTRQRTLIRGRDQAADSWVSTAQLALDPNTGEPLVLDTALDRVFGVNRGNGQTRTYFQANIGSGRSLRNVTGAGYDPATGQLVGADFSASEIVAVDVTNGQRTVLWTNGTGGVNLDNPAEVAVLEPGVRYAVADEREVWVFDRTTGDMTLLSAAGSAAGQPLQANCRSLHYSPEADLLLATDGFTLFSIDTTTGRRTVRSNTDRFSRADNIDVDATGEWVYVVDSSSRLALQGRITTASSWSFATVTNGADGGQDGFSQPTDLAVSADGTNLVVLDRGRSALIEVDIATGSRMSVSGTSDAEGTRGLGPEFLGVASVLRLPEGGFAVLDEGLDAVFSVDPSLGDRAVIAR